MASLANQTISSTYDGLIKTSSDNAVPVSGVQALEDGSGNALALSVGRSGNGVTVTGSLNATLATASQPNITSVGTLTGLTTSDDIDIEVTGSNAFLIVNRTDASTAGALNIRSNNGNNQIESLGVKDLLVSTDGTERMRIDSSGRVSINDTVSGSVATNYNPELLVGGNIVARSLTANEALIEIGGDATSAFITAGKQDGSQTARAIRFEVGTSEAMRITSGGQVAVNNQGFTAGSVFSVVGASGTNNVAAFKTSASFGNYAFFNSSGVQVGYIQTGATSTAYSTSSDYRLKENVVEMTGALDRVDALKPSRFNFITDPEKTVDGFLAHEVAEVVPEAITGEKDAVDEEGNPIYQGIDQSKIVPLLVGAIKELRAEIETLKSQLNA